jgi:predicted RNA-binding Zn ribbon-like protein
MAAYPRHRFRTGSGRLCLDFVRTLRRRGTSEAAEELRDGAALAAWITLCGPVRADTATASDTTTAQILREATFALVAGARASRGGVAVDVARQLVNRAAVAAVPAPSLGADGRLRWQADEPVTATLSLIARDALELVTSPALAKLRECANPDCGALFVDSSRPGMRRWCSMGTCGNRAKKERAAAAR